MFRRIILAVGLALALISGASAQSLTEVPILGTPFATLNLDFRGCPAAIDSRISFTRSANTATFFGSNLLLQTANANIPRLDFNYATGACNGLEIEQTSTNVALQNRDLTNAAWVKVTATAAKDQTGIDGAANSASSLTATAGTATALQTVVHVSSTDTYSVYLKCITCTGAISLSVDGLSFTTANSSICTLGNGSGAVASNLLTTAWVRCTLTQATVVNPAFGIRITNSGDKIAVDYNQLEVNGTATSPIATTTVSVARNADVAPMLTGAFGYNINQGTAQVNFMQASSGGANNRYALAVSDGTINNGLFFQAADPANSVFFAVVGGVSQVNMTGFGSRLANTPYKWVVAYNLNDYSSSLNGASVIVDTSATVPTAVTKINLGTDWVGAQPINGWLQQVKYWPQRLPNQQLIQMTRPGNQ